MCDHPPEGPPLGLIAGVIYAVLAIGFVFSAGLALGRILRW